MDKKKLLCISVLTFFFFSYCITFASASENTVVIGDDPANDMRAFDEETASEEYEDFEELTLDEDSFAGSLNKMFEDIQEDWNDPDIARPLTTEEYEDYKGIDLEQIKVSDLDEDEAKLEFKTHGNPEDLDVFMVFFWSNCSPSGDHFGGMIVAYRGLTLWETTYLIYYDNETEYGEVEMDNHGFEITFPSDWYERESNCGLKAMTITLDDVDSPELVFMDLFPNEQTVLGFVFDNWFWILLILAISIVSIVFIYYLNKMRKKEKKPGSKVRERK